MGMIIDAPYQIPMAFIGHADGLKLIDATKATIGNDKKLIDSPTAKQMAKSFLGTCTRFKNEARNYSTR